MKLSVAWRLVSQMTIVLWLQMPRLPSFFVPFLFPFFPLALGSHLKLTHISIFGNVIHVVFIFIACGVHAVGLNHPVKPSTLSQHLTEKGNSVADKGLAFVLIEAYLKEEFNGPTKFVVVVVVVVVVRW